MEIRLEPQRVAGDHGVFSVIPSEAERTNPGFPLRNLPPLVKRLETTIFEAGGLAPPSKFS